MKKTQYIVIGIDITGERESLIIQRFAFEDAAWEYADTLNATPSIWYYTVYAWNVGD